MLFVDWMQLLVHWRTTSKNHQGPVETGCISELGFQADCPTSPFHACSNPFMRCMHQRFFSWPVGRSHKQCDVKLNLTSSWDWTSICTSTLPTRQGVWLHVCVLVRRCSQGSWVVAYHQCDSNWQQFHRTLPMQQISRGTQLAPCSRFLNGSSKCLTRI